MSASGPDTLNFGCPSLITFSLVFSSPAPVLHRIRIRLMSESRRGGELRKQLPVERNLGCQAGDLITVFRVYVGEDRVRALSRS